MAELSQQYTRRARQALQFAEEESQVLNHASIGTEHMLLGLLREGAGVAARVLNDLGVTLERAREAVAALGTPVESTAQRQLTSGARYVINNALNEATRLNHHYVGTEHLLLGLVHNDEGVVSALLTRLDVSLEQVRDQVLSVVADTAQPPLPIEQRPTRTVTPTQTPHEGTRRSTPAPSVEPAGLLTTHVLDTAHGRPAANLLIELWSLGTDGRERRLLKTLRTNADGRTDEPLLVGEAFTIGIYELIFVVGDYFAAASPARTLPFLDRIPIRFGIEDATTHYHVPLLVSPWAYSTYRGS